MHLRKLLEDVGRTTEKKQRDQSPELKKGYG
jgi:hypothetical protein